VETEQALETQRLALLRLLARLVFVLAFVSTAPIVSLVPRWVRSYVLSVLVRAEAAAESLVIVSACFLFGRQAVARAMGGAITAPHPVALPERDFSAKYLLRRIAALRAKLNDLPRYAKRWMKRRSTTEATTPRKDFAVDEGPTVPKRDVIRARIERPPDRRFKFSEIFPPPAYRVGSFWRAYD